ncbi:hypothetical protein PENTCL1PPCAC_3352 [Pristionchus entomophagus]|uniref:Uncharacterized protein n=1 Tax=Pristionchus entomophagus TaxID=358040 RepID=A0AAV5SCS8_9BILA|nr:hypothetical protein PENTCL1PPCAC_3352 [Pristionchus entomophagus]
MRSTRSRQGSVASVRSKGSMEVDENEEPSRASFVSTRARNTRGPKRTLNAELPSVDEEEEEPKNVKGVKVEKEDKELTISQMLDKLCTIEKGQKALIKKLTEDLDKLFNEASESQLRRVLWTTSVIGSTEGQRLATLIIFHIGIQASTNLIKKRLIKDDIRPIDCQSYGAILLSAYRTAVVRDKANKDWDKENESNGPLTKEVIDMFSEMAEAAMRIPGKIGEKFQGTLIGSIEMADRGKYDTLIYQCFEPVLWKNLKVPHDQVRHAASLLLLRFFPIVDRSSSECQITIDDQMDFMYAMLKDECTETRREASRKILRVLSMFYSLISLHWIKKVAEHIVDINSFDSIPTVRAAVLEGFSLLVSVPEAVNVVETGLKAMLPRMIDDRNEKVRLAAVHLLIGLRGHRLIKYFDVVPMESIMGRLECETSDAVSRDIVKLVHSSFFPKKSGADERNERIVRLIKFGRNAALTFHRLIVPLGVVTLEEAAAHLRSICIVVYKTWRHGVPESGEMASVDGDTTTDFNTSIISNSSIDTSLAAIPALDEGTSSVFKRDKALMECAVVLWASIAKELKKKENEKEAQLVDRLMAKIFKKMFASFRQTSLLGTVMCIGSLLPSNLLEEYSIQILSILKEKTVEDDILEPYLEAGASWRIEELVEIIRDGLYELPSVLPTVAFPSKSSSSLSSSRSPVKKRKRTSKLSPVERIRQALHYLKYSLSSEPISSKLISECRKQLEECFEALSHVHEVVDAYLDSIEEGDEALKSLTGEDILSLYESATVLAVLMREIPTTSASSDHTTRSGRAASVGSAAPAAETEETLECEEPSASPCSVFFYASLYWLEQSLLTRIGLCTSVERNKEQLQINLVKVTLQHAETVLAACSRPPPAPTAAAMADIMRRLTAPGALSAASSEDEGGVENFARRRSSLAYTVGSAPDPPQKSYLERLSAMISALLHTRTPIILLKSTLKLHELIMSMENEEGEEACAQAYDVVKSAIAIVKRAAENPHDGEELKHGHVDAILAYTKVAIAKNPDGPDAFPYEHLMGVVRANCQLLLMKDIEERGIEDVTDHTYDLHQLIELLLHRFVFRHDKMFREFRSHMAQFALNFDPASTELDEGEEEEEKEGEGDMETKEEKKDLLESARERDYMRFVVGCQLLRLSAPEIRKAVIKEKRNEKARRSIQSDIDVSSLLAHLDKWKIAMRMDEGTETILREMIGPN